MLVSFVAEESKTKEFSSGRLHKTSANHSAALTRRWLKCIRIRRRTFLSSSSSCCCWLLTWLLMKIVWMDGNGWWCKCGRTWKSGTVFVKIETRCCVSDKSSETSECQMFSELIYILKWLEVDRWWLLCDALFFVFREWWERAKWTLTLVIHCWLNYLLARKSLIMRQ